MRDLIGVNLVKGIGVGVEKEIPNLERDINSNMGDLVYKMKSAVSFEHSSSVPASVSNINTRNSSSSVINNDNGVTQNITFNNPVKTPAETARAIRKVGRELAFV